MKSNQDFRSTQQMNETSVKSLLPKDMILNHIKSKDLFDIGQSLEAYEEIDRQYQDTIQRNQ